MLPIVPRFPVFGVGWNAFATAYPWYQTVWRTDWIGEAHNDYLQALLDGGLVGFGSWAACSWSWSCAGRSRGRAARPSSSGSSARSAGFALHELVDFNGQIPANAATLVALAALAALPVRASVERP